MFKIYDSVKLPHKDGVISGRVIKITKNYIEIKETGTDNFLKIPTYLSNILKICGKSS